jgi:DNA-binding MarR family transcriptional regulator
MEQTEDELLRAVTRAYAQAQRLQAGCCGTTSTQCQALCAIGDAGSVPQAELGARLGLEKSWVSRAVDSLEREGLVERRKCCDDARMYDVAFTEAGRARYESLNAALNAQAAAVMELIPEGERPGVRRALELLAGALSAMMADCRCGGAS